MIIFIIIDIFIFTNMIILLFPDICGDNIHHGCDHVPSAGQHPAVREQEPAVEGVHDRQHDRRRGQPDHHHGAGARLRETRSQVYAVG